ncbi:MAG: hypothetical protein ACTHMI_22475 [Mucilaginibacter sp.]
MKVSIIVLMLAIITGCKTNSRSINVFFDPSASLSIKSYRIKVASNQTILLDTTIKNTFVNKSDLIGQLKIGEDEKVNIMVKAKQRSLRLDTIKPTSSCINLFISYDNQIKIRQLYDSYMAKTIKETGKIPPFKPFADSLTSQSSPNKYDSLKIIIKKIQCK